MKAEALGEAAFKPVRIAITLETEEEASAFYAVFNNEVIRQALSWDAHETGVIRSAINAQVSTLNSFPYHDKLTKAFRAYQ